MFTFSFAPKFVGSVFSKALFVIVLFTAISTVKGQTTTFAQFFERNGSQDFVLTNNSTSADFASISGGSPILFLFSNVTGLEPSLQGTQNAHLFVTTNTTQVTSTSGSNLVQPLNKTVTVRIIRDTPTMPGVGNGARTNLLTIVFSPSGSAPTITGASNSAGITATTPDHNVAYTSDFVSFGLTTARNLSLSFSSVSPSLAAGAGSFLRDFTAAGSGTFASNPAPSPAIITAAAASLSGKVFTSASNGLKNAQVILTEADGTVHRASTGTYGNFQFSGIRSGQSVTLNVVSKRYAFAPQIVNLQGNLSDLIFNAAY